MIQVKENAPELLRRAPGRLPDDPVMTGDQQPAAPNFGLRQRVRDLV